MSKTLNISDDLTLPLEFVTQTQAILARKRVGKSYTASVQAEEMLRLGQQVLVIDYTGAWWGLRAGRDGRADGGYPIHVFGGDHADVPLEERSGEVIATAAVKERFSAILDLSHFRKGEALRFLSPFLETLYRLNRDALHLFADECDAYAPQRTFGIDDARSLGAMNDIVRRGGIRGIGCTLISQRPAVINKDILTMCSVLTCLRISHPKDIAPVREWVELHDEGNQAGEMMKSLPSLPIGTAWMWAPGWPTEAGIFQRIKVRQRETFDSGATPKPGQTVKTPKTLKAVDLVKLGETIKQTAEQARANDPAELKKKLAAAERELAARHAIGPARVETKNVPVVTDKQILRFERLVERHGVVLGKVATVLADLQTQTKLANELAGEVSTVSREIESAVRLAKQPATVHTPIGQKSGQTAMTIVARSGHTTKRVAPAVGTRNVGEIDALPKGELAVLTAVAQTDGGCSREQLTVLTGYKRSTRDAYIQRARERGYVDDRGGQIVATTAGVAALGDNFQPLPTGDALRAHWMARLPEGERKCLQVLVDAWPEIVDRDVVTEATGYKRSTRDAYLQRLGTRQLLCVGRDGVQASDQLFDGGAN